MSGIERQIDKLWRVVLPISFRRRLALTENSKVRISLDDNAIIITPSKNCCALCGADSNPHSDIQLCDVCIEKVKSM